MTSFYSATLGAYALVDGVFAIVGIFGGTQSGTPRWLLLIEGVAGILQGFDRGEQHRGGMVDRRIDDAVVGAGAAAGMGEDRVWLGVFHGFC